MAITQNTYTGNGSTVLFSFTFPYLETTDIKVSVNGTVTTAYTLANATTIQFNTAPVNGAAIRIYRQTDDAALAATFYPGSAIRSNDLNDNFTQNLYVTQESSNNASTATTTANTALTNSTTAISTANNSLSQSSTALSNSATALSQSNTAIANSATALSQSNTAISSSASAVSTSNTASSNASTALSQSNTALSNSSTALSQSTTALSNSTSALSSSASAVSTASNALSAANAAQSTANTADANANAALNAIAGTVQFALVANVAAIPSTPGNGDAIEIADSTGIQSFTPLTNLPAGFVGDTGLSVRLQYLSAGSSWNWLNYFPNNADTRYLKFAGGTITGNLEIGNTGNLTFEGSTANAFETTLAVTDPTADRTITLPDQTGNVLVSGNASIVNADVNASAAIAGIKISPNFGSQNVTTTGTSTAASFIPTSSTVPTNGLYAPSAGSVAISTSSVGRVFVDANGNVGVGAAPVVAFAGQTHLTVNHSSGGTTVAGINLATDGTRRASLITYPSNSEALRITAESTTLPITVHTNGTERLRITSAGLVGVGNSTPESYNSAADDLVVGNHVGAHGITVCSQNNSSGYIMFADGITGPQPYAGQITYDHTNNRLTLGTNDGTTGLTIDSQQRVGIGTATFDANWSPKLQVSSSATDGSGGIVIESYKPALTFVDGSASTNRKHIWADNNSLFFGSGDSTQTPQLTIDSGGRLLVGTSTSRQVTIGESAGWDPRVQVTKTGTDGGNIAAYSWSTYNTSTGGGQGIGPDIVLARSNSNTEGTHTALTSAQLLGRITFNGSNGTSFASGAYIAATADDAWASGDHPTRLVFSTCGDGASSPTERFRIQQNGNSYVTNCANFVPLTDNAVTLGANSFRWSQVWAANGTIQTSDQRAKSGITTSTLGTDFIKALRPVSYKWIEGGKVDTGKRDKDGNYIYESAPGTRTHWGFIAQEVKQVVDAAGVDFGGWVLTDKDDPDSQQALRYDQFIAPLTKALQEALAEIDVLKAKVAALESG